MSKNSIVRLKPYQYIHVLDNNTNVTRTLVGPQTYTAFNHESFVQANPQQCICIPPEHYVIIENPVQRDAAGSLVTGSDGLVKNRVGDREIRFSQPPFPLYPSEVVVQDVQRLQILSSLEAMRVVATRDFVDTVGEARIQRHAGDEWIIRGPCTYVPRIGVDEVCKLQAQVITANQALKLRARLDFTDRDGERRTAGEEWLYAEPGAFIPAVEEEVVEVIKGHILTDRKAIHLLALRDFKDSTGKHRRAGQQWMITNATAETYVPSPAEAVVALVELTRVLARQYCVVLDPVDADGTPQLGQRELRKGLTTFFLHPGESLLGGKVQDIHILAADESLILSAVQECTALGKTRKPGERWMLRGPAEYIPPVEVVVVELRKAIPLDLNEGVYIRDVRTGVVRAHIGSTVMLTENEELWEKRLSPLVEDLLTRARLTRLPGKSTAVPSAPRVTHRVVMCNVPHNSLVQVYDYKLNKSRVVCGPDLVSLGPDEEFTVCSLSGGTPKEADTIKTLALFLGPDFMTDGIVVETSDHARLQLQLAYKWEFKYDPKSPESVFSVPDFVGDACKAIASRIRGCVAGESFDSFHRNSTTLIRNAVFGECADVENSVLEFKANGLIITGVDIHSVDPVDPKTREALTKSVQLAIEITTKSQEAAALQQAASMEQEARGKLERQTIVDKADAEALRKKLLEFEASNAAIESTGSSKAESRAVAQSKLIDGESEVELASIRADAASLSAGAELEMLVKKRNLELSHRSRLNDLEVAKVRGLAEIETDKFRRVVKAIGRETLKSIAKAGPELQARLLKGLNLQGYLITDGSNPVNLLNTAQKMASQSVPTAGH